MKCRRTFGVLKGVKSGRKISAEVNMTSGAGIFADFIVHGGEVWKRNEAAFKETRIWKYPASAAT